MTGRIDQNVVLQREGTTGGVRHVLMTRARVFVADERSEGVVNGRSRVLPMV
jgi:hypothetical protein